MLFRNEEGGMYAEAVIVLPAFILIWTLVTFVHQGYEEAATTGADVRREAWLHSQYSNTWDNADAYHEGACNGSPGAGVTASNTPMIATGVGALFGLVNKVRQVAIPYVPLLINPGSRGFRLGPINLPAPPGGSWLEYTAFARDLYHYEKAGDVSRPIIGGNAQFGHHTYLVCDENETEMTRLEMNVWVGIAWLAVKRRAGV